MLGETGRKCDADLCAGQSAFRTSHISAAKSAHTELCSGLLPAARIWWMRRNHPISGQIWSKALQVGASQRADLAEVGPTENPRAWTSGREGQPATRARLPRQNAQTCLAVWFGSHPGHLMAMSQALSQTLTGLLGTLGRCSDIAAGLGILVDDGGEKAFQIGSSSRCIRGRSRVQIACFGS